MQRQLFPLAMITKARENPFASHLVESLPYRQSSFDLDRDLERLRRRNWRGAILGPHGSGKTTLLLQLFQCLKRDSIADSRPTKLWFVPRELPDQFCQWRSFCATSRPDDIILVDGIERLSWLKRLQLLGHLPVRVDGSQKWLTRSIIITTHRRLGIPVWHHTKSSKKLLVDLVLELHPQASERTMQQAESAYEKSQGNIRDVFWQLYDCHQS